MFLDKEKFAENFGEFPCTCCWLWGMGEHIFPKVFPYFFPLAVFTVRTIWYIRYILKTDLNLMIPDVVIWQLMDRVKQIRIPHPLPKNADTHSGICIFLLPRLGFEPI